jgi:hypothetical protein
MRHRGAAPGDRLDDEPVLPGAVLHAAGVREERSAADVAVHDASATRFSTDTSAYRRAYVIADPCPCGSPFASSSFISPSFDSFDGACASSYFRVGSPVVSSKDGMVDQTSPFLTRMGLIVSTIVSSAAYFDL